MTDRAHTLWTFALYAANAEVGIYLHLGWWVLATTGLIFCGWLIGRLRGTHNG